MNDTKNEPPEHKPEGTTPPPGRVEQLKRRSFLAAMAGAATAGVLLNRGAKLRGQSPSAQTYWYYDSFGNVVPVDPSVTAAGVVSPPLPAGVTPATSSPTSPPALDPGSCVSGTYINNGYHRPNILLIMVDQLRYPRWLSSPQYTAFQKFMPNLFGTSNSLWNKSYLFPNYFVAATACTPSRATLLTGLYSQQTCMFVTQESSAEPSLQPWNQGGVTGWGFPTIGDVLSQTLQNCSGGPVPAYDTAWIGKWHESDDNFSGTALTGRRTTDSRTSGASQPPSRARPTRTPTPHPMGHWKTKESAAIP